MAVIFTFYIYMCIEITLCKTLDDFNKSVVLKVQKGEWSC